MKMAWLILVDSFSPCGNSWCVNHASYFHLIELLNKIKGCDFVKIVEMKIGDIIPYEKNPRKNDDAVKYVAESIKQFGFKVPIVIDKNNVIVCGHTRYKSARLLQRCLLFPALLQTI